MNYEEYQFNNSPRNLLPKYEFTRDEFIGLLESVYHDGVSAGGGEFSNFEMMIDYFFDENGNVIQNRTREYPRKVRTEYSFGSCLPECPYCDSAVLGDEKFCSSCGLEFAER